MSNFLCCVAGFSRLWIASLAFILSQAWAAQSFAQEDVPFTLEQIETFQGLPANQQNVLIERARQENLQPQNQNSGTSQQINNLEGREGTEKDQQEPDGDSQGTQQPEKASEQEDGELRPFGYDMFSGGASTFSPTTDIPVPVDYVIGPGDVVRVQLFGQINAQYELEVTRDGELLVPNIGPVSVIGLKYEQLASMLQDKIKQQTIGVSAAITMGVLRSISVFILGEARRPGSYTVSSLSTVTNALSASGGVKKIGSLRHVQLKRNGKIIHDLDLYDLLLRGDTSDDMRLLPGDAIFIPPVGKTVSIVGSVKRPAIYELNDERTLGQLIEIAGGINADAWNTRVSISRLDGQGKRKLVQASLYRSALSNFVLEDGDRVEVYASLERIDNIIQVLGHIERPGSYAWTDGLRLSDLIIPELIKPGTDMNLGFLVRGTTGGGAGASVYYFSPRDILSSNSVYGRPLARENIVLAPGDSIFLLPAVTIFGDGGRATILTSANKRVAQLSSISDSLPIIYIKGASKVNGEYPLQRDVTYVSDFVASMDALMPGVDRSVAVHLRYIRETGLYVAEIFSPSAVIRNKKSQHDPILNSRDEVYFLQLEGEGAGAQRQNIFDQIINILEGQEKFGSPAPVVRLGGAVRFPGNFPILRESRISEVIKLAGGLDVDAYVLQGELSREIVTSEIDGIVAHVGQTVLPINISQALAGDTDENLVVQPRDVININRVPGVSESKFVELRGEFKFPGAYRISNGETVASLVERAGGFTEHASIGSAEFTRASLRELEQNQIDELAVRLKRELLVSGDGFTGEEQSEGLILLDQIAAIPARGRLVIDLAEQVSGKTEVPLELEDGDTLTVPRRRYSVSVLGEVQFATSHLFEPGKSYKYYVRRSGGETYIADEKRIFIVHSDGSVIRARGSIFNSVEVKPGDTIVVPPDVDITDPLAVIKAVTEVVSELGFGLAAFKAVGVF